MHAAITAAFLPPRGRQIDLTDRLRRGPRTLEAGTEAGSDHAATNRSKPSQPATTRQPDTARGSTGTGTADGDRDTRNQPDRRRGVEIVPFWAGLIHATADSLIRPAACPAIVAADAGAHTPTGQTAFHDRAATEPREAADLVIVDLGHELADDRLGWEAAGALRSGGILAVLTHCHRRGVVLTDPTGSVVASAQHADLLYLQHIVIPFDLLTDASTPPADPPASPHLIRHRDLLVFAKQSGAPTPAAQGPARDQAVADTAATAQNGARP